MDPSYMRALRYGKPWRDLTGDGFVMALGQEISDLRALLAAITYRNWNGEIVGKYVEDTNFTSVIDERLGKILTAIHEKKES